MGHDASRPRRNPFAPSRVGIIGGGTAGLLTALALKTFRPGLDVTLVASSRIPVIGVGEATTLPIVPFLFNYLGIDPARFEREVEPTFKLGIRFEWGRPEPWYFNAAFGDGDVVDAQLHDGHPLRYSMTSQLMSAARAPLVDLGPRLHPLLKETRFALHLDNERLVRFLHERLRAAGVVHIDAMIADVAVRDGEVSHVTCDDGRELAYDLWVDCSGFRGLLIGKALEVPWQSFASSLFTDTAVIAVRDNGGEPRPYTTATTMDAGWCWTIPMRGEDHLGYVHCSRFLDPDEAAAELVARFPGARDFKTVRFSSGRRRDFIAGNVAAIGNAYGFVEPLQSTAIHLIIIHIARLMAVLATKGDNASEMSAELGRSWDWLRWFLASHYHFNRRRETPFWSEVREAADWSGLKDTVDDFVTHGAQSQEGQGRAPRWRDSVFGPRMLEIILVGQGVAPQRMIPTTTKADWDELMAMREAVVARALTQRQTWERLRADPSLFQGLVRDPDSWCRKMGDAMRRAAAAQ